MSDQEKSGHKVAEDSSVVMVEKEPTDSQHKPFRPTELQDEQPDQPHIRSKAPAVPTVGELKNLPEDGPATAARESKKERKDVENKSSEAHKRESKKSKRRGSAASPETIALTTIDVEPVREKMALPSQPIPADVMSITSAVSEPIPKAVGKLLNEEELAALTPQTTKRISEWQDYEDVDSTEKENVTEEEVTKSETDNDSHMSMETSSRHLNKKEISWNDPEYLDNVHLRIITTESQILGVERKASVGPCFRPGMPYEGPSGITICLPRKSNKNLMEEKPRNSGICISISKVYKSFQSKSKCRIINEVNINEEKPKEEPIEQLNAPVYCLSELRGKFDAMCIKIRNAFKI